MTRILPSVPLRRWVASIDIIEGGGDALVLPSTGAVLGFQYRGRVRAGSTLLAPAGVTGIQSQARTYAYEPGTASLLIRFTPDGVGGLGIPAAKLADQSVPLDALLAPPEIADVREQLLAAGDSAARIAVVERFLSRRPYPSDPLVRRALTLLDVEVGRAAVADVAHALGVSVRQLERRFLARVGVTPRRYIALRRLERVTTLAQSAPSLTAAALEAGYYDQSHFIRDFQRFVGASPRRYFSTLG